MSRSLATGPCWSNRTACESTTSTTSMSECSGTSDRHGCVTRKPPLTLHPAQRDSMPSRYWPMLASRGAPPHTVYCESSTPADAFAVAGGCERFWSTSPREAAQSSSTGTSIVWSGRMGYLEPRGRPVRPRRLACVIATPNTAKSSWSNSTAACFTTQHPHGTGTSSAISMPRSMAGQPSDSPTTRCSTDPAGPPPRSLKCCGSTG